MTRRPEHQLGQRESQVELPPEVCDSEQSLCPQSTIDQILHAPLSSKALCEQRLE